MYVVRRVCGKSFKFRCNNIGGYKTKARLNSTNKLEIRQKAIIAIERQPKASSFQMMDAPEYPYRLELHQKQIKLPNITSTEVERHSPSNEPATTDQEQSLSI